MMIKKKQDKTRKRLWEKEYRLLKGINLTYSDEIPPVISEVKDYLADKKNILDLGCGKGRIGLHLVRMGFSVTGLDFASSALREFKEFARRSRLSHHITLVKQDINNKWGVPDNKFDIIFAITMINNLISHEQRIHFIKESIRVLHDKGLLILETFTRDDGYYSRLQSTDKDETIVIDPYNQIQFKIYSETEVLSLFQNDFSLLMQKSFSFKSIKYGKEYQRHSKLYVFKRNQR
ncbi:MAG: class I SAM-dependent methyltransferase [Spirochaetes bacterium]|nr:class I SAM-dependent methyltransferase [Spirochaetota bacterium]